MQEESVKLKTNVSIISTYMSLATSGIGMSSLMETDFFRGLGLVGELALGWFALFAATEERIIRKSYSENIPPTEPLILTDNC